MCSATLHSFDVKKLSERIMHFPTWVDLKGEDSVPETVHHVVVPVNPKKDKVWERLGKDRIQVHVAVTLFIYETHRLQDACLHRCRIRRQEMFVLTTLILLLQTDEVHAKDNTRPGANTPGKLQTTACPEVFYRTVF